MIGVLWYGLLVACAAPDAVKPVNKTLLYQGNSTPANISSVNAVRIARFVFNIDQPSGMRVTRALFSAQGGDRMDKLLEHHQALVAAPTLALGALQSVATTQLGRDGGSVYIVSEHDSVAQKTTNTMVYQHFQAQGQHLHGRVQMTTTKLGRWQVQVQYQFQHLAIQQGQSHVILEGKQSITTDLQRLETVVIANYLVEDVQTGQQVQSVGFISIYKDDQSVLSGVLYHSVLGRLEVQTDAALHTSANAPFPFAGGPLYVLGMANQRLRISPLAEAVVFVEADTNGDAVFDYTAGEVSLAD